MNLLLSKIDLFVLLSVLLLSMTGCSKDDIEPLRIVDSASDEIGDNVWLIYYPGNDEGCITISGGERPYSVSCDSDILKVNMNKWPNAFNYEVLGVGETEVKISDATGQSIVLKVKIDYRSQEIRILETDVYVVGDQMTVAAQKELKKKALATVPVKAGGGYKFVYTRESSGTIYAYTDQFGGTSSGEGTFVYGRQETETGSYPFFQISLDGKERIFVLQRYYPTKTRSDVMVPFGLYEELSGVYKEEYPEVEKVYSVQVIDTRRK